MRTSNRTFMTELMNEHIEMPGAPSLIVTRHEAWHFLASIGYETDTRKTQFGSVDYMVFNPRQIALDEPLSPPDVRDAFFAAMRAKA